MGFRLIAHMNALPYHVAKTKPSGKEGIFMITFEEAIEQRHSVRQYTDEPLSAEHCASLEAEIARCNAEGNLHMSLVRDEPEAFSSAMARYGSFRNVRNYIVIAGTPADDLDRRAGYYGERIVLLAQQLGLNTCWVALTFKKRFVKKMLQDGDELALVIAIGHGETAGKPRKSKNAKDVSSCTEPAPDWFVRGVKAALLAPTAVNQQKFRLTLADAKANPPLVAATTDSGPYAQVDLGIAMLHFEIAAGKESFAWE